MTHVKRIEWIDDRCRQDHHVAVSQDDPPDGQHSNAVDALDQFGTSG